MWLLVGSRREDSKRAYDVRQELTLMYRRGENRDKAKAGDRYERGTEKGILCGPTKFKLSFMTDPAKSSCPVLSMVGRTIFY